MAKDYAGATPLDTALNRLGVAPEKPVSIKDSFDDIARKTQVPANVLMALDDGSGDTGRAESNAQFLARAVEGGTKIEDAVRALAGDDAAGQALLQRSYEIADQLYPSDTPAPSSDSEGSLLGDLGKLAVGGAVRGTGSAIRGAGVMVDDIAQRYRGTRDDPGESLARSGSRAAGEAVEGVGDAVSQSVSDEMKAAQQGTQPGGELLDPSTWTLGEDPSLRGIAGIAAEGIGSMVPVVASALVAGPGAAGVVGGAMGGGEGASNARQFVMDAASTIGEDGQPEITNLPEFQKLIEAGRNPDEATSILAQLAETDSAFAQSIPAALGGMATSRIISAADGWVGRGGRLARAAKKGAVGAVEEGTQEAIEGAAGKAGLAGATGADLNLAEDSFGDFIGGALAGGGIGVAAGSLSPGADPTAQPSTDDGSLNPLALPAPGPAQGGSLVPAPRQITSDPNVQNPNFAFPGLPAPEGDVPFSPETGIVPAPRQIGFDPNVQNPNWSFPSGSPNPGADGSGTGPAAVPGDSLPLSGGDPGAAATNLPMGALPGPVPPAGLLPPPSGPVEALAQEIPAPQTEPAPPHQRFPEHKPGATVRLFDPVAQAPADGIFLGETDSGALVRIGGQEVEFDPAQFDSARDAAKVADEVAKEQAKQQKDTGTSAVSEPVVQNDSVPTDETGQDVVEGGDVASDAGPQPTPEDSHRAAFTEAAKRRETAYDAMEAAGMPETGPERDEVNAAIKSLRSVREASIRDLGKAKTEELFAAADAATVGVAGQQPGIDTQGPVAEAAAESAPDPSEGQKEAGNYRMGHARWNGLDLSIENQKGSQRSGTDPDGNEWSVTMPAHYGYFRGTKGADGDHVDFYMGDNEAAESVYVIDQTDMTTGKFDEHKVMIGFDSPQDARQAHTAAFSDGNGLERFGGIRKMSMPAFKEWLAKGDTKIPATDALRRKEAKQSPSPSDAAASQPDANPATSEWPWKGKKINTKTRKMAINDYFRPGNIVESYGGGHDRVMSFDRDSGAITVEAVERDDGQWRSTGERRVHSTLPEDRNLRRGPVELAAPQEPNSNSPAEPSPAASPAPQKRPLINYVVKELGGINPTGRIAEELRHRGVSSKTAPGLWRKLGRKELDNIPASEHPDLEALVGRSDDGLYLNPANILDAILEEVAGRPQPLGEQAILQQAARDADAADTAARTGDADTGNIEPDQSVPIRDQDIRTDEERQADIAASLDEAIEDFGLYSALTYADREAIIERLDRDGGDVDDAIYDFLARGDNNAIRESSSDGPEAAEIPDVPFGDERNDQRPERNDRAENRSGTQSESVQGSGEREGNDPDTASNDAGQQVTTEAGAEGLPQQVIPGTERSDAQAQQAGSDRARLELLARQQQTKMGRVDGNSADAGPLFDTQQDLLSGVTLDAPAPTPASAPDSGGKIEDFGEKLEGARKDIWSSYADRMDEAEDIDISAEPLSKSWPAPDYQKLIDAGVDPWTVSFIRVARDAIPTKPQKAWRIKGWVKNVDTLRDFANSLMREEVSRADIESRINDIDTGRTNVLRSIELYEAVGHSKSLKGLRFASAQYSFIDGQRHDPPLSRWEVTSAAKATAFSNMPRIIAHGDTKEAALTAFKKAHASLDQQQDKGKKGAKFLIYSRRITGGERSYHIGVKIGRNHVDLRNVADVKEARRLISEEADELQAQLDRMRDIPNERRDSNSPRVGVDHRSGADVSPEQFSDTFGFRGVQFGNWVEGGRRQQDLNEAFDAMMDLAGILDLPPKALSLNGTLGLAFGARGSGGRNPAAAHYEPNQVVINLTKKQGRGSLAHEWFHAADNYFSRQRERKDGFITDNVLPGDQVDGIRPELVDAFAEVRRAIGKTDLKKRSANIDKMRTSPYWSTGIELHARAFESYVIAKLQDQNASNDYLANIVNGAAWGMQAEMSGLGDSYPYLKPAEIETVRPAFDALFNTIQTRDTDQGVEMFSRFPDREPVASVERSSVIKGDTLPQRQANAIVWFRENLLGRTVTNRNTGHKIGFNMKGGKESIQRTGDDILALIPALPAILENGTHIGSEPDQRNRPDVKAIHKFSASVEVNGRVERVIAIVRETANGTFHYRLAKENVGARTQGSTVNLNREKRQVFAPALEGDTDAINLTIDRSEINGPVKAPRAARARHVNAAVTAELRKVGLAGKVQAEIGGDGRGAAGSYRTGVISVFRDAGGNWRETLDHEIIHALRDSARWGGSHGLFTGDEWRALVKAARANQHLVRRVNAAYPDLPTAGRTEEMVAEMYAEWARGERAQGLVQRAFEKLRQFFQAVARGLRSSDNPDAAAIMDRIAQGEIGGRGPDGPSGGSSVTRERRVELADTLGAAASRAKGLLGNLHWKKTPALFSSLLTDAMGKNDRLNILSLVPGHPLFAELGKRLPAAQEYLRMKQEMDAERNRWQAKAAETVDDWTRKGRKNPKANNALMDLMHRSTIAGIDPSYLNTWKRPVDDEARRVKKTDSAARQEWAAKVLAEAEQRERTWHVFRGIFDGLPKEFQELYRGIRDEYSTLADDMDGALIGNIKTANSVALKRAQRRHRKEIARIRDEGLTGAERDAAVEQADKRLANARKRAAEGGGAKLTQLRLAFETNRMQGPYFPLARFGKYFVSIRDGGGKVISFSRFETVAQQETFIRQAEQDKLGKIERGVIGENADLKGKVDPRFVAEIEELMGNAGADPMLMDAVWQHWLETLPDQSVRTNRIHRKGREGFNRDAVRAYSSAMFHGAHQIARLRRGLEMDEALHVAEEQAASSDNAERAGFIVSEMRRRHEFTMSPTNNPLVTAGTNLAFVWYLGMSPASALVNISQTTIFGVPIMAARFKKAGVSGATRQLYRALRDFGDGKGHIEKSSRLNDDEQRAMKEGYRRGTIDKTQAHDLAAVAESGVEYNAVREKAMRVISWMFHHTERLNREVTYLANYRMFRSDGLSHEDAIDQADAMVKKIHYDYQNTARPRFMQGDMGKLFLTMRNFTVNSLYRLFRDTHQAFNGATKEERLEARNQLVGITLSMMAHAGIKGVWGYGILMGLLGVFFPGDGDDVEEWLQDALLMDGDDLGTAAWNFGMAMVLNGAPGTVTSTDLTSRIGMPNLWFRDPWRDMEGRDLWNHRLNELAGPVFGIPASFYAGASMLSEGMIGRGSEKMVPNAIADMLKFGRQVKDGVMTTNGDPIVENLNPWEALVVASGFTPARVSERYSINNRLKEKEREISDRRSAIHREIGDAIRAGDPVPAKSLKRMREFNREWPEWPITADTIQQSVRGRMRASQRNEFGVSLNPKINSRIRAERAPAIYG